MRRRNEINEIQKKSRTCLLKGLGTPIRLMNNVLGSPNLHTDAVSEA